LSLSDRLEEYNRYVTAWRDAARKETAAVQRLQKAVAVGALRDLDKLRQAARSASEAVSDAAEACPEFEFNGSEYLSPDGGFLQELKDAAANAGVRLTEREGVIYSYPVLVQVKPELLAVKIDRRLEAGVLPEALAATLKKLQSKEPKSRPEAFIETLFKAYELVRVSKRHPDYIDERLMDIYGVLTLLPGSKSDYSELEFTRDIYFLDTSDVKATRAGAESSFTASTGSRERSGKIYRFVGRDGYEKVYGSVKFSLGGKSAQGADLNGG